ncbi:nuclear transport factor 2 family protein [Ohtaekwangia sp.]|uniref:nuclear transport factor 2 family protein n=1 Tax=Ohtaekwangia sp. TaxID=2066019 RepID=UPI002F955FB0
METQSQINTMEIANLLYKYCEFIDSGDLVSASLLFRHAKLKLITSNELQDYKAMLALLQQAIVIYSNGTPRTKHVLSNPIIHIDEEKGTASSQSYYTVFQATESIPLQVIATGRYFDKFEYIEGHWRFSYRESQSDMLGNISGHIRLDEVLSKQLNTQN